jgi:hypothetical protein
MAQTEVLGSCLYVTGFALAGRLTVERLKYVLQQTVVLLGMDTGGMKPMVWVYPLPNGRGGIGETVVQPLSSPDWPITIVQPLVESFVVADAWPELEKTYVVLASCRPFNAMALATYLQREIGRVLQQGSFEL